MYLINSVFIFNSQNSSQKVKDVAKSMNFRASKTDCVFGGHYILSDDKVWLCYILLLLLKNIYISFSQGGGCFDFSFSFFCASAHLVLIC